MYGKCFEHTDIIGLQYDITYGNSIQIRNSSRQGSLPLYTCVPTMCKYALCMFKIVPSCRPTYDVHLLLAVGKCAQLNVSVRIGWLCTLTPTFMAIYHHAGLCATKL
jgi:hypothetical protein